VKSRKTKNVSMPSSERRFAIPAKLDLKEICWMMVARWKALSLLILSKPTNQGHSNKEFGNIRILDTLFTLSEILVSSNGRCGAKV